MVTHTAEVLRRVALLIAAQDYPHALQEAQAEADRLDGLPTMPHAPAEAASGVQEDTE